MKQMFHSFHKNMQHNTDNKQDKCFFENKT